MTLRQRAGSKRCSTVNGVESGPIARLNHRLPKYREHVRGRAVVTPGGRDPYLGTHGSAASRREYQRLTAEWVNLGCPGAGLPDAGTADALTVKEMVLAFMRHAATYYGDSGNGQIQVGSGSHQLLPPAAVARHGRARHE